MGGIECHLATGMPIKVGHPSIGCHGDVTAAMDAASVVREYLDTTGSANMKLLASNNAKPLQPIRAVHCEDPLHPVNVYDVVASAANETQHTLVKVGIFDTPPALHAHQVHDCVYQLELVHQTLADEDQDVVVTEHVAEVALVQLAPPHAHHPQPDQAQRGGVEGVEPVVVVVDVHHIGQRVRQGHTLDPRTYGPTTNAIGWHIVYWYLGAIPINAHVNILLLHLN